MLLFFIFCLLPLFIVYYHTDINYPWNNRIKATQDNKNRFGILFNVVPSRDRANDKERKVGFEPRDCWILIAHLTDWATEACSLFKTYATLNTIEYLTIFEEFIKLFNYIPICFITKLFEINISSLIFLGCPIISNYSSILRTIHHCK